MSDNQNKPDHEPACGVDGCDTCEWIATRDAA